MAIIKTLNIKTGENAEINLFAHGGYVDVGVISLSFTGFCPYVQFTSHLSPEIARKVAQGLLLCADLLDPTASEAGLYDAHAPSAGEEEHF